MQLPPASLSCTPLFSSLFVLFPLLFLLSCILLFPPHLHYLFSSRLIISCFGERTALRGKGTGIVSGPEDGGSDGMKWLQGKKGWKFWNVEWNFLMKLPDEMIKYWVSLMRMPPATPSLSLASVGLFCPQSHRLRLTVNEPKTCEPPPPKEIVSSSVCLFVAPAVCHPRLDWASVTSDVRRPVLTLEEVMTNTPTQVKLRQEATLAFLLLHLKRRGLEGRGGERQEKKREVVMGTDTESPVCKETKWQNSGAIEWKAAQFHIEKRKDNAASLRKPVCYFALREVPAAAQKRHQQKLPP